MNKKDEPLKTRLYQDRDDEQVTRVVQRGLQPYQPVEDQPTHILHQSQDATAGGSLYPDPQQTVVGPRIMPSAQALHPNVQARAAPSGGPGGEARTAHFVTGIPHDSLGLPHNVRATAQGVEPVVGFVIVVRGPGSGSFRPIFYGMNALGRGEDQRVSLDFGDQRISREAHAFIIYDDMERRFYIRDGGKSNLVRLNARPVMQPTELSARDILELGDTSLCFLPFCGPDFDWQPTNDAASD
jgi:hypothetical protein